jgi:uncharacterized membrane protein
LDGRPPATGRRKEMIAVQTLPPIPSWNELHPLVIHFPIALLLVAPLFIVIGIIVNPGKGRPFLTAALVLMLLGTAGTFFAIATGEAAGEIVERTPAVSAVLERHEDLAEMTRIVFSVLTLLFAAILLLPRLLKREPSVATARILPLAFLIFYSAGAVILVNTAHNGGRLVHELGVHARITQSNATPQSPASGSPLLKKQRPNTESSFNQSSAAGLIPYLVSL